jgi:hypothetical protein
MTGVRGAGVRRGALRALVVGTLVPLSALVLAGIARADVTAVDGRTSGIAATAVVLNIPLDLAATPSVALPATGSAMVTDSRAAVTVPGLLSAAIATTSAQGALGAAGSGRSTADVTGLVVGNALVTALTADAVSSSCTSNEAGSSGDTTVAGLWVLGTPLAVATAPNTTLDVPGVGTLHVNEQTAAGAAPSSSITVTALRLELDVPGLATGEIVVGRSVCGVTGTGVVVPVGAVGGVALSGLAAVVIGMGRIHRYRRGGPVPA